MAYTYPSNYYTIYAVIGLWALSAHPWYAANRMPPSHRAHGMPPMAYTYPSTYYTIHAVIGYGHCRPTRRMPPMVCRPAIVPMVCRPSIVPMVCRPSIFMALGPSVYIIYFIYHIS
ncbi:hypothetical protein M405DRAFT_864950 [Rhizopogon salebrosus TDB-379]|nr:hypothetical protein M405DRAFT_864950 [Rhizopogon salebrosus TDB-379]